MRILLIQPGLGRALGFQRLALVEPLGLEMVASSLIACGHEVKILDLRIDQNLEKWISDFDPSLCGISCSFTIDVYQTLRIAQAIKNVKKDIFVVVGGHHASLNPSDFSHPSVDTVVIGEGESTTPDLVSALKDRRDIEHVPGLVINRRGQQKITPLRETIKNLDSLPLPSRHLLQEYRGQYYLGFQKPLVTVETARGCPYRCEFCSVWKFYRGQCRVKTPERVVEEIVPLRGKYLFFTDDNFFLSAQRAQRIAELLLEKGIRKRITIQARSDAIVAHPELISLWKKAGLWKVFIGFEKIEDAELCALGKSNTVWNNEEALRILRSNKVEVCASFIVDTQYERKDFRKLRHYIRQWRLYSPSLSILTPLPGTDLFHRLKNRLTSRNLELFDLAHAVLPTRLNLRDFYREFSALYRAGYLRAGMGWEILTVWVRRWTSTGKLFKMLKSAWAMGSARYYLSGHKRI